MTWFKLDDQFHSHPKVLAAGNAAIGLYCRLGTYCADKLTDGFIAKAVAASMGTKAELRALTACPIPDARPLLALVDGGYLMSDYLEYNPSRETVLADRAKAKDRMDKVRGRSAEVRANNRRTNAVGSPTGSHVPVPDPVPNDYISDNSTPENTAEGVDNSRRSLAIKAYADLAVQLAKEQRKIRTSEEGYHKSALKTGANHPELDKWLAMFPEAETSALAAWMHGDKHSMAYTFRANTEANDLAAWANVHPIRSDIA